MSAGPLARREARLRATALLAAAVVTLALVAAVVLGARAASFGYDDPFQRFPHGGPAAASRQAVPPRSVSPRLEAFLKAVVGDIQTFWAGQFERSGRPYTPAVVVVFKGATMSGCGPASSATGPFYCPLDHTVYLDPGFFRALAVEFHAPGDFAPAYVLAHELGHHVQTLTGITQQVDEAAASEPTLRNALSVALELQADCLAGVWADSTYDRGLLERGDLDEALRAAAAVGDDRIQRRTIGRVVPEAFTHGTAAQRRTWLRRGFDAGDPKACDTFSALL